MKQLVFIYILLILFTASAQAAPISVGNINDINVANILLSSSSSADCASNKTRNDCDFVNSVSSLLTDPELGSTITSDPANYVIPSEVGNGASFDIGFNGFDIFNGDGDDLVIFIVGNGSSFGLDVIGNDDSIILTNTFDVTVANTVYDKDGNWLCVGGQDNLCSEGYALSAVLIDFGQNVAGDLAVKNIHISLNNSAFSLAGGFHTEASLAAVPLPLSAILFSSGLFLLGLIGRRKAA